MAIFDIILIVFYIKQALPQVEDKHFKYKYVFGKMGGRNLIGGLKSEIQMMPMMVDFFETFSDK